MERHRRRVEGYRSVVELLGTPTTPDFRTPYAIAREYDGVAHEMLKPYGKVG
jgi:hypothetical protein